MDRTDAVLQQYGALPFLLTDDGAVRILLVTTRGRREWIIPKGWPIRHLTPGATAAREAYEEAGVLGTVMSDNPIGSFRYAKQRNSRKAAICEVSVFLFAVDRQVRKWPEKAERLTKWFTPAEASAAVATAELSALLLRSANDVQRLSPGIRDVRRGLLTFGARASSLPERLDKTQGRIYHGGRPEDGESH